MTDAKKVKENIEGIEFVVPRNQNQAKVIRNFLSGNFGLNGDYPLLDKVQKKKLNSWYDLLIKMILMITKKVVVISEDAYKQLV